MNVGDYVRTEDGTITRIKMFFEKKWEEPELIYARFLCENNEMYDYPRQAKSSPNIIDLIEVGDYVNGARVTNFMFDGDKKIGVFVEATAWGYDDNEIKSIVTKEQFESMQYKVGD